MTIPSKKGSSTSATQAGVAAGGTLNVAVPSGAATDDVYIIFSAAYEYGGSIDAAATCSGFTQIAYRHYMATDALNVTVLARKYTGTEGSNFTVTQPTSANDYMTLGCAVYQDADVSGSNLENLLDGTPVTKGGASDDHTLPALTTSDANSLAMAVVGVFYGAFSTSVTGWTNTDSWDGDYVGVWDKDMASAGSTGTATVATSGSTPFVDIVLALAEAGGTDANVSATTVSVTGSVLAPTPAAGAALTATTVGVTGSVLAPTPAAGAALTATTVGVTGSVLAPTPAAGASLTATTVGVTGSVLAPTVEAVSLTIEQEGFRFRTDSGNEATPTWEAAQDENVSMSAEVTKGLRVLIDYTGDPGSQVPKLQYRKVGDADWIDVA